MRKIYDIKMPTQEDISIVEAYLSRSLERPKTNTAKAVVYTLSLIFISIIITAIIWCVKNQISESADGDTFRKSVDISVLVLYYLRVLCTVVILTLRITLIGLVHLYQHYAPEKVRRRCLCKPSCSEYMIMAIKKYGPFFGTFKGIRRLLQTCDGVVYKIDYP